ncbi:hypothetical protein P9B03_01915 [Metasolibacillus meyeri]|uniref:Uncharacterized protein n=1 Tax=Metasolibacillus meyeri TaxID=1071052 RepID=A0AAW9NR64_9BACL|nr:hypothetical protein [Metasolibacillus meyeri]MEC1177226.1 hypothetical protein [Metasolibacillus meyeri]
MNEQKLDLILRELQKVNERIATIDQRVTNIDTKQQRHCEHIQQLIQLVGATNENLTKLEAATLKRFGQVDCGLRMLEADFDLILSKTNEHERDINRLKHVE